MKNSEMKKRVNLVQVVEKFPSQLICLLCKNLVHLPLDCTVCEASFVNNTFRTWAEQSNTQRDVKKFILKKSHVMFRNSLDDLNVLCKNSHLGCPVVTKLAVREHILKNVVLQLLDCPNQSVGCEFQGTNCQLEEHHALFLHQTLVCNHNCGASFYKINKHLHS